MFMPSCDILHKNDCVIPTKRETSLLLCANYTPKRAEYRFGSLGFEYDIAALDYSHREKVTITSPLPRASAQPVRSSMRPRRV